jgi:hypothetical protein
VLWVTGYYDWISWMESKEKSGFLEELEIPVNHCFMKIWNRFNSKIIRSLTQTIKYLTIGRKKKTTEKWFMVYCKCISIVFAW